MRFTLSTDSGILLHEFLPAAVGSKGSSEKPCYVCSIRFLVNFTGVNFSILALKIASTRSFSFYVGWQGLR